MQHVVIFKFDIEKLESEFGKLSELQKCFDELKSYIPGVGYIEIKEKDPAPWEGYEDASQAYTHVLLSTHISADDLKVYADHPQHAALQCRMAKCMLAPPLRVELYDSKQENPETAPRNSANVNDPASLPQYQHIVLFKMDHVRLKDEFGSFEGLAEQLARLQTVVPGTGYVEVKVKNPEPWPRYPDASDGYSHVLISTHSTAEDLKGYAQDEQHLMIQKKMKKAMMCAPLRIELKFPLQE